MIGPNTNHTIYLFRHGETEWNIEGRRQGHLDSPLTERGRLQAVENARRLLRRRSDDWEIRVFTSPLGRARQSARIIAKEIGLSEEKLQFEPSLMECSFGLWEGLTEREIKSRYPEEWRARLYDRWSVPAPMGESYADVHARVSEWYNLAPLTQTSLVVCHGLTSRVFRGIYADLSQQQVFDMCEPQDGFYELSEQSITFVK